MDFTKYFQQLRDGQEVKDGSSQDDDNAPSNLAKKILDAEKMLSSYRNTSPEQKSAIENLKKIKYEIDKPKENKPDARLEKIKENLGEAECHQVIREERWNSAVYCPYCYSTDIDRMPPNTQKSPYNFRYFCCACHSRFNDDSRTPFETKLPSLETWMQCWFLLGCTDSIEYIAVKLNLDLSKIKDMIEKLQKVFGAKQPLTKFMKYEQWHKAYGEKTSAKINAEIISKKQQELHQGETTAQPKDTAEVRRQKDIKKSNLDGKKPHPKF